MKNFLFVIGYAVLFTIAANIMALITGAAAIVYIFYLIIKWVLDKCFKKWYNIIVNIEN